MIIGIIHKGSGLGDQLFSYIATRVRAADLGVDFGFVGKEFFKGRFMKVDWGKDTGLNYLVTPLSGEVGFPIKELNDSIVRLNTPYYDPEFNFIPDGSIIDGYGAQDIRYFEHRLDEVREWLKVEPLDMGDKVVMNIRGGEYRSIPDLILPFNYWVSGADSIHTTREVKREIEVHTDDVVYCEEMFGTNFPIIKDIALNWRSIRYAKHLIISNSAFAILPALLNENVKEVIAPKYWAGRNVGEWRRPGNYYKKFLYI